MRLCGKLLISFLLVTCVGFNNVSIAKTLKDKSAKVSSEQLVDSEKFNELFDRANQNSKDLIFLGGYNPRTVTKKSDVKKLKSSISDFKKCVLMDGTHWQSMFLMAKSYQALGEHKEALQWFERAMQIEKTNISLPKEASLQAIHMHDIDKAVSYSDAALKINPDDQQVLGNHAMNLFLAARDDEARNAIEKALIIDPSDVININIENLIRDVAEGKRKKPKIEDIFK